MKRTNIFIMVMVFALTISAGILVAGSVAWLRHGVPTHETVQIESDILDQKTIKSKKWLKTESNKDYFYQCTVEYTTKRGTFPFLDVDTLVVEPNEIWERKHFK